MPYKRKGNIVYVKRGDKWQKKAEAKSVDAATKMINLLRGVKKGWKPTGKK